MPPKPVPIDPIQLAFNVMNTLMKKGAISYEEAREILNESLPPHMPSEEREKILNSLIKKI